MVVDDWAFANAAISEPTTMNELRKQYLPIFNMIPYKFAIDKFCEFLKSRRREL